MRDNGKYWPSVCHHMPGCYSIQFYKNCIHKNVVSDVYKKPFCCVNSEIIQDNVQDLHGGNTNKMTHNNSTLFAITFI